MRIQDADAGDVLQDADGSIWCMSTNGRCYVVAREGARVCGGEWYRVENAEEFGPFTRLVPEKETP